MENLNCSFPRKSFIKFAALLVSYERVETGRFLEVDLQLSKILIC